MKISKIKNKLIYWLYSTWLGSKYLEFLLWLDNQNSNKIYVNHKEVNQIVIQAQKILYREGINQIKRKVKQILDSKDKKEYDAALKQLTDFMPLAERDSKEAAKLKKALYEAYVKKDKDIKTSKDFAKMIDNRIQDYLELQTHTSKRDLLREIRKLRREGNIELAEQKEQEFKEKYGRK